MEKSLKAMFDFQKFEGNADLKNVIHSVHERYPEMESGLHELNLNDMEWVAAAGTPTNDVKRKKKDDHA